MRPLLKISGMAAGAVRLIGARRPGCRLAVSLVAIQTTNRGIVSAICRRTMLVADWNPGTGVMAGVTLKARHKMINRLAGCGCPIMTS